MRYCVVADFLVAIGMADIVNAAAANCNTGH